ncbi:MAG: hypothetical protein ACKODK_22595 [Opitutaceae bacterium]
MPVPLIAKPAIGVPAVPPIWARVAIFTIRAALASAAIAELKYTPATAATNLSPGHEITHRVFMPEPYARHMNHGRQFRTTIRNLDVSQPR